MDKSDSPTAKNHHKSSNDGAADDGEKSTKAADLIRQKLDSIYDHEPTAKEEIKEVSQLSGRLSVHQQYMKQLSSSGKSVAEIQTAWHEYYQGLSEQAKHDVWQEFYAQSQPQAGPTSNHIHQPELEAPIPESHHTVTHSHNSTQQKRKKTTVADYKQHLVRRSGAKKKLSAKHHLQSMIFGVGVGAFVVVVLLFGFFNERFIAPFITPSRQVNNTPIIVDPGSAASSDKSVIIIPKINLEIPVIYGQGTAEASMQKGLERGVVHYASTPQPGERGNVAIFGHSSNNIFNPGKYKFAFVLLAKLENGDLFYIDKGGKRYAYKVYKKHVVEPNQIEVLNTQDKPDTATLITCDPPGTSLRRMVVVGEQISPAISKNVASTAKKDTSQLQALPSNAPSLWQRIVNWF